MENMPEEQSEKKHGAEHLKPWHFKPGQSGNPSGRPKGSVSLKEYAKKYLRGLSDEQKEKFMEGLDKKTVWEMAEGKAKQDTTTDIKIDNTLIGLIKGSNEEDTNEGGD